MSALVLLSSLLVFVTATFSGFRIVLRFLNVSQDANKRSALLTGVFIGTQVVCGGIFLLIGIPEISSIAAVIMFGLIVRRFLVLEIWQMILIPIFVSFFAAILTAISLLILFQGQSSWGFCSFSQELLSTVFNELFSGSRAFVVWSSLVNIGCSIRFKRVYFYLNG